MNNVKKMVLVESRTFEMMKSSQHEKSLIQNVMSDVDAEMNSDISRSDIPISEKVKLCNQVLQRYMTYKDKLENTPVKVRIEDKTLLYLVAYLFIFLSRESDQCAIRARLGVAGHLSTTPRWGNPAKCLSQRHNK